MYPCEGADPMGYRAIELVFIWNLATPDTEGFFGIEGFNIEDFVDID